MDVRTTDDRKQGHRAGRPPRQDQKGWPINQCREMLEVLGRVRPRGKDGKKSLTLQRTWMVIGANAPILTNEQETCRQKTERREGSARM